MIIFLIIRPSFAHVRHHSSVELLDVFRGCLSRIFIFRRSRRISFAWVTSKPTRSIFTTAVYVVDTISDTCWQASQTTFFALSPDISPSRGRCSTIHLALESVARGSYRQLRKRRIPLWTFQCLFAFLDPFPFRASILRRRVWFSND